MPVYREGDATMTTEENQEQCPGIDEAIEKADERLAVGDNWEALRLYLEIIEEDPENAYAINKAGVAYARMGEMEHAERCFYDAVIIDHRFVPALSNLGNIFLDREQNEIAIALYRKGLRYDPNYSVAHNNIAAAYKRIGKIDKQVNHFKRSQKIMAFGRGRESPEEMVSGSEDRDYDPESVPRRPRRRFGCLGGLVTLIGLLALLGFAVG